MYQNVTDRKFMFFSKNKTNSSDFHYLEPGLHPSITEIVEAMSTLIQQRHDHSESCITVKVSRRTEKVEICFTRKKSGLKFFSTDLRHIFGFNVANEYILMLRRKGPHKFAYDIVTKEF